MKFQSFSRIFSFFSIYVYEALKWVWLGKAKSVFYVFFPLKFFFFIFALVYDSSGRYSPAFVIFVFDITIKILFFSSSVHTRYSSFCFH